LSLPAGTRIGAYDIVSLLGEGGMGEVYRATDTNLKRQVALKVLPASVAGDAERLARFQREAEVLASLNHPHIAQIYGVERSAGATALVMELVEGEDLAQRISRGAIPLDEALPMARQIAEALEAAHEQGIVHRDLKPANIKVRPDGTVKVLDFGLARAMEPGAPSGAAMQAATITSPAMTQAGMILGTAAYMSPEQASGKPVDKRTDLWAFGVVLLEMLTGQRVFDGDTVTHVLASVLKDQPDFSTLPPGTPRPIRTLLRRCLQKDRRQRLADAADARFEIDEALTEPSSGESRAQPSASPSSARVLPWLVAGTLGLALATVLALGRVSLSNDEGPSRPLVQFDVELGPDVTLPAPATSGSSIVISPDGSRLVYRSGSPPTLFTRPLNQPKASEIPGTGGARAPFFSPDGKWIGFFVGPKLQKVSVDGGAVVAVGEVPGAQSASWGDDDVMYVGAGLKGMLRVAAGGPPEAVAELAEGEIGHQEPEVLPGGGAVLFTVDRPGPPDRNSVDVITLADRQRKVVLRGAASARYVAGPDGAGHLVYASGATLFAVPFDLRLLETRGTAVPLLEGVAHDVVTGAAQFAVSRDGTLVYRRARGDARALATVQWMDAAGRTTPLRTIAGDYASPRLSPDGTRLAMAVTQGGNIDIWVLDIQRDAMLRLTSGGINNRLAWSPDGQHVAFSRAGEGIWITRADGASQPQLLTGRLLQYPYSFTPDGKRLVYVQASQLWTVALDQQGGTWKAGAPERFLDSKFSDTQPAFSPDGRWLAYQSDESGRLEIYVRPFSEPSGGRAGKWQVSIDGGTEPFWSRKGDVVFRSDGRIMAAGYTVKGDTFIPEKPRVWIEGLDLRSGRSQDWDLAPDGTRIAVLQPEGTSREPARDHQFVVVQHFADEVRRRVPAR
jgi:serine/threonine protein kinase